MGRTPHTFSTATMQDDGGFGPPTLVCVPLIPRNSPLPVTKSEVFYTMYPGQKAVNITAYQGEHPEPALNSLVGKFMCEGLDPNAPGNSPIVISFGLDLSGMLKVTATEKSTGLTKTVTLDTHNLAAPVDLEASRQRISELLIGPGGDPDADEDEDDDEEEDFGDDDDARFIETIHPNQNAAPPDQDELLQTAKQLRQQAETLLAKNISPEDAAEINTLLDKARHSIAARDWTGLQTGLDSLSDLLFYLED